MKPLLILLALCSTASAGSYRTYDTRGHSQWGNTTRYGGTVYDTQGNFGWWYSTPHSQGVMTSPWERESPRSYGNESRFVPLNRLGR